MYLFSRIYSPRPTTKLSQRMDAAGLFFLLQQKKKQSYKNREVGLYIPLHFNIEYKTQKKLKENVFFVTLENC